MLLESTIEAICRGTIAVQEVKVITGDPCSQKNFEEITNILRRDAGAILQKLQVAKNHLQMFEHKRSQVLALTSWLQGHCKAEAKSKSFSMHSICCLAAEHLVLNECTIS